MEPATGTGDPGARDAAGATSHVANLSRVYSNETWSVYDLLDRSLDPRGPDWLLDRAGRLLAPGSAVLDFGCRDAYHLIRLVRDSDITGVGIEPVAIHVERARAAVAEARLDQRIQIVHCTMEDCAFPTGISTWSGAATSSNRSTRWCPPCGRRRGWCGPTGTCSSTPPWPPTCWSRVRRRC